MSFFGQLDRELQKDIIDFVEKQEAQKGKQMLRDAISANILRHIIGGECRITGCVTDHKKKKMFVEYTFYEEDEQ